MYKAKFDDGEWVIVDDNEEVVDSSDGRRDAVLKAARMNREESQGGDNGVSTHRGSSYGGDKFEVDDLEENSSEYDVKMAVQKYREQLRKTGFNSKNAAMEISKRFGVSPETIKREYEKSFIPTYSVTESGSAREYKVTFKRNQKGFSSSAMGQHNHLKREVVFSAKDWDEAKEKIQSLTKAGEFVWRVTLVDPVSDDERSKQVVKAKQQMDSMNESSEEYGGGVIPVYHVATDRIGNVTITKDHGGSVYLQGDEATDFRRQMNRMRTNKVSEDKIMYFLSQYDDVMQESQEVNELSKKTLGSYVNQAAQNIRSRTQEREFSAGQSFNQDLNRNTQKAYNSLAKNQDRDITNRLKGIKMATSKLTKESDEIDEAGRQKQPADADAAHELFLYATNDSNLYERSALPIIANLQRKLKKGVYDAELAIKLWRYHADQAAKGYSKEFGGSFTPATRDLTAKQLRDYYDEDVQSVVEESLEEAAKKAWIATIEDTKTGKQRTFKFQTARSEKVAAKNELRAGEFVKKIELNPKQKKDIKESTLNGLTKESVELVEGKLKQLKDKFVALKVKAKDTKDPKIAKQLDKIRNDIKAEEKILKDQFIELKKIKDQTPEVKAKLQKVRDQLKESYCETLEESILNIKFLND